MKLPYLFTVLLSLTGCLKPMYETDFPLYRQYKYWESADKDWQEVDYFRILVYRMQDGTKTALRLIPQRDGLPSTADGYIQAAQKAAFNLMATACGSSMPAVEASAAPRDGRIIDRFFYQFGDASIGVTYSCPRGKPHGMDLAAEQQKWSLAQRRWDQIGNIRAVVDTLQPRADGRRQIRIRLFGGTIVDNRRLAQITMQNTCPNVNFRLLDEKSGIDIVPAGRLPEVVSDDNVRIYDFTCTP